MGNLIQNFRRIGQKMKGWRYSMDMQAAQISLVKKLYSQNGLQLYLTCPACPEQYDVFRNGERVAYYRLRHGEFTIDFPDVMGECIFEASPNGDGIFDEDERLKFMTIAMRKLIAKIEQHD